MLGARIVDPVIYTELSGLSAVTAAVAGRIINGPVVPQGVALPACNFWMEHSVYNTPELDTSAPIYQETLRYVIRFLVQGASDEPVLAAAEAALAHFHGARFDVPGGTVWFSAQGEYPLTAFTEGGDQYRQLGTVYTVEITSGG